MHGRSLQGENASNKIEFDGGLFCHNYAAFHRPPMHPKALPMHSPRSTSTCIPHAQVLLRGVAAQASVLLAAARLQVGSFGALWA